VYRSTSFDFPLLLLSDPADARPAVFIHLCEVFQAFEINWHISSFFMCSFLADWVGLVDVINAADFKIMGAIGRKSQGDECKYEYDDFHL